MKFIVRKMLTTGHNRKPNQGRTPFMNGDDHLHWRLLTLIIKGEGGDTRYRKGVGGKSITSTWGGGFYFYSGQGPLDLTP